MSRSRYNLPNTDVHRSMSNAPAHSVGYLNTPSTTRTVRSIRHCSQTPNTKQQTPNTKHQTPNTKHQTSNTKQHSTHQRIKHQNTKHQSPNIKHQTSKHKLRPTPQFGIGGIGTGTTNMHPTYKRYKVKITATVPSSRTEGRGRLSNSSARISPSRAATSLFA